MIRFGILGTGLIAEYHRDAIAANHMFGAKLVAVSTRRSTHFAAAETAFGVPCVSECELLERDDVDVICICTPSGLHASQTLAAIAAGKHVLVEKPFALSLVDAERINEAAQQNGVQVGVVLQRRADPTFRMMAKRLADGIVGRPALATLTIAYHRPQSYYDQAAWRGTRELDGGGVLMNQGIHLVDLLVWYLGDAISAHAHGATLVRSIEAEDTLTATLRFAQGTLATVSATTATYPGVPHRLELFGTDGYIRIEGEVVSACHPEVGFPIRRSSAPPDSGAATSARGISIDGHRRLVRDIIEAVQLQRPPLVGVLEARRSLAAVLAIYEAAGLTRHA